MMIKQQDCTSVFQGNIDLMLMSAQRCAQILREQSISGGAARGACMRRVPEECPVEVKKLVDACLKARPGGRPTINEVLTILYNAPDV